MEIEQEKFNISMRKFLKKVGITSQQKIEEAVKSEIERKKALNNNIKVSVKLEIKEINLVHLIDGEICLKDNWWMMNDALIIKVKNKLKEIYNPLTNRDIISDNILKSVEIKNDVIILILEIDPSKLKTMDDLKNNVEKKIE